MGFVAHWKNTIRPFTPNMVIPVEYEHNRWYIGRTILSWMSCIWGPVVEHDPHILVSDHATRKNEMFTANSSPEIHISGHVDYTSYPIPISTLTRTNADDSDSDGDDQTTSNPYTKTYIVYGLDGQLIR